MIPSMPVPADPILQALIEKAIGDLAQRLGRSASEIILVDAMNVTWPDSSLGCPQEGMGYTQVLTPGFLIKLRFGDQEYEYHANRDTYVIYCENPMPPIPGTPFDV